MEIPNKFPLHTKTALVTRSCSRREGLGVASALGKGLGQRGWFRITAAQLDCFWFLFLTSGLARNFNISRGNRVHSAFSTSNTKGLHSEERLTRAGRAVVFPRQACAEPLPGKGYVRAGMLHEKLLHQYKRNSRQRSFFPSGSRCDSWVASTLSQGGSATQSSWASP